MVGTCEKAVDDSRDIHKDSLVDSDVGHNTLCFALNLWQCPGFPSIKSHPHLVPDILQQFISICVKGAGTEGCVPAILLEPAGQVHPASLVQVQLLLGDQVRAIHPWVGVWPGQRGGSAIIYIGREPLNLILSNSALGKMMSWSLLEANRIYQSRGKDTALEAF